MSLLGPLKHWISERVHFKVSSDLIDVEFQEWEQLRDLSVLGQGEALEQYFWVFVDHISLIVNEIPLHVDQPSLFVDRTALRVSAHYDVAFSVFV